MKRLKQWIWDKATKAAFERQHQELVDAHRNLRRIACAIIRRTPRGRLRVMQRHLAEVGSDPVLGVEVDNALKEIRLFEAQKKRK